MKNEIYLKLENGPLRYLPFSALGDVAIFKYNFYSIFVTQGFLFVVAVVVIYSYISLIILFIKYLKYSLKYFKC